MNWTLACIEKVSEEDYLIKRVANPPKETVELRCAKPLEVRVTLSQISRPTQKVIVTLDKLCEELVSDLQVCQACPTGE